MTYFHGVSTPFGAPAPRLKPKSATPRPVAKIMARPTLTPKKAPKKKAPPRRLPVAGRSLTEELEDPEACLRSPCGIPDPKTSEEAIKAARRLVGQPKLRRRMEVYCAHDVNVKESCSRCARIEDPKERAAERYIKFLPSRDVHRPGDGGWPLTVAYGLGLDSTAILVGLVQLYRETGDARWVPEAITFADTGGEHPETYAYLRGMNAWLKRNGFPEVTVVAWVTEKQSDSWGMSRTLEQNSINNQTLPSISISGKSNCSDKFKQLPQRHWLAANVKAAPGGQIIRAIGYDATEGYRATKGSTYNAANEEKHGQAAWYPLVEWGWDRARCYVEVEAEIGAVPRKSSCYFCGAMKPEEVLALPVELLKRALFMELVAKHGVHGLRTVKGLGRNWSWVDFALGEVKKLPRRQAVFFTGGVIDYANPKRPLVVLGATKKDVIRPTQTYHAPRQPLLSRAEVAKIEAQAKEWIAAFPSKRGQVDVSKLAITKKVDAYRKPLGFRGTRSMTWDRFDMLVSKGRVANNPPAGPADLGPPADRGLLPRDPLLAGSPPSRANPFLPPAPGSYYYPDRPADQAFVPAPLPSSEHPRPPQGLNFALLATGQQPLVYAPAGRAEAPRVSETLHALLRRPPQEGLASPGAWEDLLASAKAAGAIVYAVDRRGERYELRDVLFDHGGETGRLLLRHLGARSREGDLAIDLRAAYGYMLPLVVYKHYPGGP